VQSIYFSDALVLFFSISSSLGALIVISYRLGHRVERHQEILVVCCLCSFCFLLCTYQLFSYTNSLVVCPSPAQNLSAYDSMVSVASGWFPYENILILRCLF
jgi:hypothetical protein